MATKEEILKLTQFLMELKKNKNDKNEYNRPENEKEYEQKMHSPPDLDEGTYLDRDLHTTVYDKNKN